VNAFEQNLLFAVTALIGLGTVIALVVQFVRSRRDDDEG
jgi:hypothetical protein